MSTLGGVRGGNRKESPYSIDGYRFECARGQCLGLNLAVVGAHRIRPRTMLIATPRARP